MKKTKNLQPLRPLKVELEEQMQTIKLEAKKCHKMLKIPNIFDVEDLIQEGVALLYGIYERYDSKKGASFSTFFYRSLINRLNCILIKSYDDINKSELKCFQTYSIDNYEEMPTKKQCSPHSVCNLINNIEKLSTEAKKYIIFCLNTPKKAQLQIVKNQHLKHKIAREYFGMNWTKEFNVRKEIVKLLREQT